MSTGSAVRIYFFTLENSALFRLGNGWPKQEPLTAPMQWSIIIIIKVHALLHCKRQCLQHIYVVIQISKLITSFSKQFSFVAISLIPFTFLLPADLEICIQAFKHVQPVNKCTKVIWQHERNTKQTLGPVVSFSAHILLPLSATFSPLTMSNTYSCS